MSNNPTLTEQTRTMLIEHGCVNTRVLVGVSGGLDSVSLLHVLHELRQPLGLHVVVAHINHGLRGEESASDATFVAGLCSRMNTDCEVVQVDVRSHAEQVHSGIEGAARELRYSVLDELAAKHLTPFLLIAHNRDDVAETFLLNLARGTGINGLSSIPESRLTKGGIRLLRPLLRCPRTQIAEYAEQHGLEWREDATNVDIQYFRNRIRQAVIPFLKQELGADIAEKIAGTSRHLRNVRKIVSDTVRAAAMDVLDVENGRLVVHIEPLELLSRPLQAEVVMRGLRMVLGKPPDRDMVERILGLVRAETGSQCSLQGAWSGFRERKAIVIAEGRELLPDQVVVVLADGAYVAGSCSLNLKTLPVENVLAVPGRNIAYVDADMLSGALTWRPWQPGDRFQPHGMQGSILVSDLLTNHKVAHTRRTDVFVLCDDIGIIWVCGIRPAERVRVRSSTTQVRELQYVDTNGPIVVD